MSEVGVAAGVDVMYWWCSWLMVSRPVNGGQTSSYAEDEVVGDGWMVVLVKDGEVREIVQRYLMYVNPWVT